MPRPARRAADLVSVVRLAQLSPTGATREPIRLSSGKERITQSPKPPPPPHPLIGTPLPGLQGCLTGFCSCVCPAACGLASLWCLVWHRRLREWEMDF